MAEETPAVADVDRRAADEGKPPGYDAFLSYAHRDKAATAAIQKGLHQIGRRMGQLRALRVFRDDTNLTANPDLWGKITEALDSSRFMILVLSPQSASSHWVNEEVSYWLQHRGNEQLMLVLAAGHLAWDETNKTFDPEQSDAAPPVLTKPGSLPAEPLYIDISQDAPWDVRDRLLRDKLTSLAAAVHGKPKDQLAGDDVREQRGFRRLRRAAITGLAVLTVTAVVAAVIAVMQRQQALQNLHDAVVAKLNAEGAAMLADTTPGGDVRALQELLAANAIEPNGVPILSAQISRFATQAIIDTGSAPRGLAYSPDGRRIATAQVDGSVRQWNSATGKPIGSPLTGHSGRVIDVAYTYDGQTVASTGHDGTMRLYNASTGAALNPNPQHVDSQDTIAMTPDGKSVFTGGNNDAIHVWDPHTGKLLATRNVFNDNKTRISDVTFDRSGNLFAASGLDRGVAIFDTNPVEPHAPIIAVRGIGGTTPSPVWQIAFSPDGHSIAAAADDLQLSNADTGNLIRPIPLGGARTAFASTVAFSPDGRRIATGRTDGAVQLWDANTGVQLGQTLTGHTAGVVGMAFSPDGRQIATTSLDGTLRLWSATLGQPMRGSDSVLVQVAFSPDGHRVAASGDTAVQQWDVGSGDPLPPLTPGGMGVKWFSFANGGPMVTAAADGTIEVWNATTGRPLQPPVNLTITGDDITWAFGADGRTVAWGSRGHAAVYLSDVMTGRSIGQPMTVEAPDASLSGLAFSPDGHHLAAGYGDGLRLWNTDTTKPEGAVMAHPGSINPVGTVAFSRDAAIVATGHVDGTVELWDPTTHKQLVHSPLGGHTGEVYGLAFGVDHQLASGGSDATFRLWDTANGTPTAAPLNRSDTVDSVAISADGRLAASASLDGSVLLSPALPDPSQLCDKLTANMSRKQWRNWVSTGIGYITVCPALPIAPD